MLEKELTNNGPLIPSAAKHSIYYGIFANRVRGDLLPKVFAILGYDYWKIKADIARLDSWWRRQLIRFTQLDPLFCELCLIPYDLVSVVYASGNSTYFDNVTLT